MQCSERISRLKPKVIRSSSPDVVVAVGSGDSKQEFECYSIALSFASRYFDTMLSTKMTENETGRIEFPDKDPKEWQQFYRFIDPNQIGIVKNDAVIDSGNALTLVAWFHEFQMDTHVKECDLVLAKMMTVLFTRRNFGEAFKPDEAFWARRDDPTRKAAFEEIIDMLQSSCFYDLIETKAIAENAISWFLERMLAKTSDLFDLPTIKLLVELSLPLEDVGSEDYQYFESCSNSGNTDVLWAFLCIMDFNDRLQGLSIEDVNNNNMLPVLVRLPHCASSPFFCDCSQSRGG